MSFALFVCFVFLPLAPLSAQKAYKVKDKQLDEISGIAASHQYEDMYYVHNDSGGESKLYFIDGKGKTKAILSLSGISNRDWEDIAVGPGPHPTNYVYIGEIGDNQAKYPNYCLYRLMEHSWTFGEAQLDFKDSTGRVIAKYRSQKSYWKFFSDMSRVEPVDSLGFIYEDGPKDCETLMIDPANGDVYLVSKREDKVGVYQIKAPLSTDSLNVAKRILSLDFALAVGGDISPQRDKIIIKTYNRVYQWRIAPGQSIAEALSGAYETLPYKVEPQGEAICYSADGKSYLTLSERDKKKPLYLYKYDIAE